MRTPIVHWVSFVVAAFSSAACGGSVVAEPGDGTGAGGGGSSATTSTTTVTCGLGGPCDLGCCAGYACTAGACQPRLADDRCWSTSFPATCDPRAAAGCGTGSSCALGLDDISVGCGGPAPIGDLGLVCDATSGCKPTLMCGLDHVCGKACCSEVECAAGQLCNKFAAQVGDLGVCGP